MKAKISAANRSGVNLSGWCNRLVGQLSQSRTRPACSCQWQWQEPERRRFYHVTSCPYGLPWLCRGANPFLDNIGKLGYSYILTPANHFKQMLGVLCAKKYIPSMQSLKRDNVDFPSELTMPILEPHRATSFLSCSSSSVGHSDNSGTS